LLNVKFNDERVTVTILEGYSL